MKELNLNDYCLTKSYVIANFGLHNMIGSILNYKRLCPSVCE